MYTLLLANKVSEEPPAWSKILAIVMVSFVLVSLLAVAILVILKRPQWKAKKAEEERMRVEEQRKLDEPILQKNIEYIRKFFVEFRERMKNDYSKNDEECISFIKNISQHWASTLDSTYEKISRSGELIILCREKPRYFFQYANLVLSSEECTFDDFLESYVPKIADRLMALSHKTASLAKLRDLEKMDRQWEMGLDDDHVSALYNSCLYNFIPESALRYYGMSSMTIPKLNIPSSSPSNFSLAVTGAAVAKAMNQINSSQQRDQVVNVIVIYFNSKIATSIYISSPMRCPESELGNLQAMFPEKFLSGSD